MSCTIVSTHTKEDWEAVWELWLSSLLPWELHWLTPRELDLHDKFVAEEVSLAEIEAMIDTDQKPAHLK